MRASALVLGPLLLTARVWSLGLIELLLFACVVGSIGALAWVRTTETGWARFFRTGPALLIPLVYLWATISHYFCSGETACSQDLWRKLPFHVAVGVAVLWHLALIVYSKGRSGFDWVYAIVFIPTFYLFCMFALVLAIKFPL